MTGWYLKPSWMVLANWTSIHPLYPAAINHFLDCEMDSDPWDDRPSWIDGETGEEIPFDMFLDS